MCCVDNALSASKELLPYLSNSLSRWITQVLKTLRQIIAWRDKMKRRSIPT